MYVFILNIQICRHIYAHVSYGLLPALVGRIAIDTMYTQYAVEKAHVFFPQGMLLVW